MQITLRLARPHGHELESGLRELEACMSGSPRPRPAVRAVLAAITTTSVSVAINYATGWTSNLLAWLVVAVLTLAAAVLTLQSSRRADGQSRGSDEAGTRTGIIRNVTANAPSAILGQGTQHIHMDLGDGRHEAPPQ